MCKHKGNCWLTEEIFVFGCKESREVQEEGAAAWLPAVLPSTEDPPLPSPPPFPTASAVTYECSDVQGSMAALKCVCHTVPWVCLCSDHLQRFVHAYFPGGTTAWGSAVSTLPLPKQLMNMQVGDWRLCLWCATTWLQVGSRICKVAVLGLDMSCNSLADPLHG